MLPNRFPLTPFFFLQSMTARRAQWRGSSQTTADRATTSESRPSRPSRAAAKRPPPRNRKEAITASSSKTRSRATPDRAPKKGKNKTGETEDEDMDFPSNSNAHDLHGHDNEFTENLDEQEDDDEPIDGKAQKMSQCSGSDQIPRRSLEVNENENETVNEDETHGEDNRHGTAEVDEALPDSIDENDLLICTEIHGTPTVKNSTIPSLDKVPSTPTNPIRLRLSHSLTKKSDEKPKNSVDDDEEALLCAISGTPYVPPSSAVTHSSLGSHQGIDNRVVLTSQQSSTSGKKGVANKKIVESVSNSVSQQFEFPKDSDDLEFLGKHSFTHSYKKKKTTASIGGSSGIAGEQSSSFRVASNWKPDSDVDADASNKAGEMTSVSQLRVALRNFDTYLPGADDDARKKTMALLSRVRFLIIC
jgi:hypothetical protein